MGRNLLRLSSATLLLLVGAAAVGVLAFYLIESPPYHRTSSIEAHLTPAELLRSLGEKQRSLRFLESSRLSLSESNRSTFIWSQIYRIRDIPPRYGDIARAEAFFNPLGQAVGRADLSEVTLRKFADPFQSRLALLEIASSYGVPGTIYNPIQGYMFFSRSGSMDLYVWVDGVWLGMIYSINERWMSTLLSYFPNVARRGEPAPPLSLEAAGPREYLALPVAGLIIAILIWPVVASRSLALRPQAKVPRQPVDELRRRLLALNGDDRRWKVCRLSENEFVAEWKLDDRSWQGLFGRRGLMRARALRMRLDGRRRAVRAMDDGYQVRTEGGWAPDGKVEIRRRPIFGLDLADWRPSSKRNNGANPGGRNASPAEWGYDVSLIKGEIVETVLGAGWSYQPVTFMIWS